MFISKKGYIEMQKLNSTLTLENERLKNKIEKLEEEKNKKIQELREEYEENKKLYKKLLAVERLLDSVFGSYNNILKFRNKVRNIIKNEDI